MNTELSSKYDPSAVEAVAYQVWLDEDCFRADPADPGDPFTIVIPPPNVTGALHLGHAINTTLQDILVRAHRMMGFNTLWVPGIDHAGIATQAVVERQLKEQENKTRHDVGREGLVARIWQWKEQYGDRILAQLKRLGCSCDWSRTRFTLDDMCAAAVRETFFKLFRDGLIYRGKRLVNWDTFLQTSISDDEIYHETVKTNLWHIRYEIVGEGAEGHVGEGTKGLREEGTEGRAGEGTKGQRDEGTEGRASVPDDSLSTTLSPSVPQSLRPLVPSPARPSVPSPLSPSVPSSLSPFPHVTPSPGTPGEGGGGGEVYNSPERDPSHNSPHPNPPPEYRERGKDTAPRPTYLIVATTRPETLLGDTAVAVHSGDPRWNWAIGKFVRLPLTGRLIPIIADDILVDPKFGTGVVKVTPAHDPNDYAVWSRHRGQADEIEIINILTPDGKITSDRPEWSKYAGLKRTAARTAIVEDLKAAGLLEKEEPYESQVGHSDRSKTPVEPYLSDQWFVKMAPLAEPALEVVREGKIKFYPERHAQQYLGWLGEKRDWPVSRQLWWGHRIPVWTYKLVGWEMRPTEDGRDLEDFLPLADQQALFAAIDLQKLHPGRVAIWNDLDAEEFTDIETFLHYEDGPPEYLYACLKDDDLQNISKLEKAGFTQDPDVLDTWFSSALWPHSTLGWPDATPDLARYYPTSVLLTGRDIITLWVARMVMMGMYNMGLAPSPGTPGEGRGGGRSFEAGEHDSSVDSPLPNPPPAHRERGQDQGAVADAAQRTRRNDATQLGLPFLDVAINPTILDGRGERMSKSKGNGVDPVDIIDGHGADALRFTLTNMATETQDARMPVQVVCPHCGERLPNPDNKDPAMVCGKCGKTLTRPINNAVGSLEAPLARMTSDRFDLGRNFCNKLWNACRFALGNLEALAAPASAPPRALGAASLGGTTSAAGLSLVDRWIVSRLHRATAECDAAIKAYRFDVYAKACYDFFWRDFCDWYVEAIKPAMKDAARAPAVAEVLAAVLDGALRLMHPMIPFITETIWWRLNDVRPTRGLPGLLECPPSKRLVRAAWPRAGAEDAGAEAQFTSLQQLISAIRTIRNDHQVNPRTTVNAAIRADGADADNILANREMVELLATCVLTAVGPAVAAPANAVTASVAGADIFVEGMVDPSAEKLRLRKELEAREKLVESMKGRLGNEAYIAKAPAKLVQQTKDQLAAAEADLVKLKDALARLG